MQYSFRDRISFKLMVSYTILQLTAAVGSKDPRNKSFPDKLPEHKAKITYTAAYQVALQRSKTTVVYG